MSEMVARVAKAIFASQANDRSLDKVDRLTRESVLMAARAAIEAMREPTEAMITVMAGYDWSERLERFVPPRLMRPFEDDAADCWRKMIDEALK